MKTVRVNIQQPALPLYRVPFFASLAKAGGLSLKIYHGSEEPELPNAPAIGFDASLHLFTRRDLPVIGPLFWHAIQWTLASPRYSDVLILSWNTRVLSLWPALIRARMTGVPVILWGHGLSKDPRPWRNWLRILPTRFATSIILYGEQARTEMRNAGVTAEKLFVSENGLDSAAIAQTQTLYRPDDLHVFRQQHVPDASHIAIHVGRLHADSKLCSAIKAIPLLLRRYPDLRLVIVGEGDAEKQRLQELAAELGVQDSLVWTGAIYDESVLAPWMMISDAFVYPANAGLSVIHAFNYGLPVVIAQPLSAHNPEAYAIKTDINGVIAESCSDHDVAAALDKIFSDVDARQSMSSAATETASTRFNIGSMTNCFTNAIEYSLKERGGARTN